MEARGFRAEIDAAGNAIGTIGSGTRQIVLLGHIDTVPGHIPVRIENGELWGRGAVDAKGPLCTFVAAAAAAGPDLGATVTVVGAVGEERLGSPGARAVAAWDAPDYLRHRRAKRLGRRLPRLPWHARVPLSAAPAVAPHRRSRRISRRASHRVLERPRCRTRRHERRKWRVDWVHDHRSRAARDAFGRERVGRRSGHVDGLRLPPESIRTACKSACESLPDRR